MKRREFLAAGGAAILARCASPRRADTGTIVESYRSAPESLDPQRAFSDVAHEVFGRVYSGLLRYDRRGQLVGDLAIRFDATPDVISIELADEIWWHDGKRLMAEDVVDSLAKYSSSDYPFSTSMKAIRRVDVDAWPRVRILLERPSYAVLHALTSRILPSHVRDLDDTPVGTGFYRIENRDGEALTLKPHRRYHGHAASIECVRCKTVPDPTTQYLELGGGECDLAEIPIDLLQAASRDARLERRVQFLSIPSRAVEFLFFNLRRLGDRVIREAISLCVDRDQIARYLYWGHARSVESPFLDPEWRAPQITARNFDPQRASALLQAAGYERSEGGLVSKEGKRVELTILHNADSTKRAQVAQVIQQSVSRGLGLGMKVVALEKTLYEKLLFRGDYDCAVYGFSFSADPDDLGNLYRSDSEFNASAFKNADVDELFSKARDLLPGKEKREYYAAIQRTIAAELPSLPLLTYNIPMGVSRRLAVVPPLVIGDTYRFTREQNLWTFAAGAPP